MMLPVEFKRWAFQADRAATREAHDAIPSGSPERCGCLYCRNFAAARSAVYPQEALALFDRLGIRPDREAEIWEGGPVDNGRVFYAGWFHFIGESLSGKDAKVKLTETSGTWDLEEMGGGFAMGITADAELVPSSMRDRPILQLEWHAHVPWVLSEPHP